MPYTEYIKDKLNSLMLKIPKQHTGIIKESLMELINSIDKIEGLIGAEDRKVLTDKKKEALSAFRDITNNQNQND